MRHLTWYVFRHKDGGLSVTSAQEERQARRNLGSVPLDLVDVCGSKIQAINLKNALEGDEQTK